MSRKIIVENKGYFGILNMNSVFILWHSYDLDGCEETKLIGVYKTQDDAQAAINRLKKQSGFCDRPDDFHIDKYEIGKDHWTEGYITM